MEDDWESEDFVPVAPVIAKEIPKGLWDDEDADGEENIKESWEDEEDPAPEPKSTTASSTTSKSEKSKSAETKGTKSKEDKKTTESKKKAVRVEDEKLADPLAEKLRQQRLVEEADYQSTTELFGKGSGQKTLDGFIPKSEEDFQEYAELIALHLRPYEKSYHYLNLLKAVMRHSMTALKGADAKEVASSLTAIANEKIKSEKEANAGKKKGGARKQKLLVERADDDLYSGGAYDGADDYDFM